MRIGILTGGGDVPGLNPCIKALVNGAERRGWSVLGVRRGWAGLLNVRLDEPFEAQRAWVEPLSSQVVRTIDRSGGTYLHTSRTNPAKVRRSDMPAFLAPSYPIAEGRAEVDCTAHVLKALQHLGIDALAPIGGDDTLSYAVRLHREGVPIVAIPKTMDNDVFGTDYCIGFSTAVSRSVEFINALRTPTGSHERIAVIELFGRNSGETALMSGYLADADRTLISEVPFDIEHLARLIIDDRSRNPSNYAVVVLSEGVRMVNDAVVEHGTEDAYGHKKLGGIGAVVGDALKRLTGIDIISQQLAYLMRAGVPDALDRMVAISYANMAIEQIEQRRYGLMMALQRGIYTAAPIGTCVSGKKRVDVAELYDVESYCPRIRGMIGKPLFLY
jgi:6-phosphofructokinase 1